MAQNHQKFAKTTIFPGETTHFPRKTTVKALNPPSTPPQLHFKKPKRLVGDHPFRGPPALSITLQSGVQLLEFKTAGLGFPSGFGKRSPPVWVSSLSLICFLIVGKPFLFWFLYVFYSGKTNFFLFFSVSLCLFEWENQGVSKKGVLVR